MISITSVDFDLGGALTLTPLPESAESEYRRRFNRVPTLDFEVAVNDGGFSDGDRDLVYKIKPTREQDATLRYLIRTYSRVRVSTPEGCYLAVMSYTPEPGKSTLTISLVSSLT